MTTNITGIGTALGSQKVTNTNLEERVNLSSKVIYDKTGIKARYRIGSNENIYTLMAVAAHIAMQQSDIKPEDIQGVYTSSNNLQNRQYPQIDSIVSNLLGIHNFERGGNVTGCSGGIVQLGHIKRALETSEQEIKNYLLINGDHTSNALSHNSTDNMIFSDAASAITLSNKQGGLYEVLDVVDETNTENMNVFSKKISTDLLHKGLDVYKFAIGRVPNIAKKQIQKLIGENKEFYLIPHQSNLRILKKHKNYFDNVYTDGIRKIGNTNMSSVFFGLQEAYQNNEDRLIVLNGYGEGLNVATAALKPLERSNSTTKNPDIDALKKHYWNKYQNIMKTG